MSSQPEKMNEGFAVVGQQTEIIEAKLQVTKFVATISEKRNTFAQGGAASCRGQQGGSGGLQSQLVDGAISRLASNLPAEVLRVTQLQRHQGSTISSLQAELTLLEEQHKKAMTRSEEMKEEVERYRRQTYLLEEESTRKYRHCIQLKDDIMALVKDGERKRRQLTAKKEQLRLLKKQLGGYGERLSEYSDCVASTDSGNSKVQADIHHVEKRLASLTDKKDFLKQNPEEEERICSGSAERELKEKVTLLTTETDHLQAQVRQLQDKLEATRAKETQVKQATSVLMKRNAAQVLRLKRQVKEQQLRRRQWEEQCRLLNHNVATLTHRLDTA